jgi:hypothetical protein
MRTLVSCSALICLLLTLAIDAAAAVYRYTDESGRTVFVDGEEKIPARYRSTSSQIQTSRPTVPSTAGEGDVVSADQPGQPGETGEVIEPPEPAAQTIVDRTLEQRARQEAAQLDRARTYQTPVMVRGNRVLVPVEIVNGGQSAHLMLLLDADTPMTTLHRSAVQGLRFPPGEQTTLQMAGGRAVKAEKVLAGLIDIGPFELKEFPVALITPQGGSRAFDGTLGMDFLKDHPYTVDYQREMLRWQQPPR